MGRGCIRSVVEPEMEEGGIRGLIAAFGFREIIDKVIKGDWIRCTFLFSLLVSFLLPSDATFLTLANSVANESVGEIWARRTKGSPPSLLVPTLISSSPVSRWTRTRKAARRIVKDDVGCESLVPWRASRNKASWISGSIDRERAASTSLGGEGRV